MPPKTTMNVDREDLEDSEEHLEIEMMQMQRDVDRMDTLKRGALQKLAKVRASQVTKSKATLSCQCLQNEQTIEVLCAREHEKRRN